MKKLSILAGPAALAAYFLFAVAVSATPLDDLGSVAASSIDLGAGYLDAGITDRTTEGKPDEEASAGGTAPDTGLARDWLRVKARFGSDAEHSVLETGFGAPSETRLGSSSALDEALAEEISLEEVGRRLLSQGGLARRLRGNRRGQSQGQGQGLDLGLNLVRSVLETRLDRELALTSLAHTMEIRQFLLEHTASDHVSEYEVRSDGSSPAATQAATAAAAQKEALITAGRFEEIKRTNEGSPIKSLKQFISEFLIDFRIFFFFGISLVLILLLSTLVTRWVKVKA